MAAKPVPDGFHTITPYITVRDAVKAIEFYKQAFGAKEVMRMPGPGGKLMHAEILIGNSHVMLSDEFPEMGAHSPAALNGTPVSLHMYVPDCDKTFNQAVAAGATALRPPADMFWGSRFGLVQDPFGHKWSVSTHLEDLTTEEIMRRHDEMMAKGK